MRLGEFSKHLVIGHRDSANLADAISSQLGRDLLLVASWGDLDLNAVGRSARTLYLVGSHERLTQEFVASLTAVAADIGVPVGLRPVPSGQPWPSGGLDQGSASDDVLLYSDFLTAPATSSHVFGPQESDTFVDRARQGSAAIVLQAHGNGADLRVGSQVICARAAMPRRTESMQERLPCQGGGSCRLHRHNEFRAFHQIAGALNTRFLVLMSCAGYQPAGGIIGFDYQLAGQWLGPPDSARALVTSTRLAFNKPDLAFACARAVRRGLSAGELALHLNRRSELGNASYVCLGDPAFKVGGQPNTISADPLAKDVQEERTGVNRPWGTNHDAGERVLDKRRATQAWLVSRLVCTDDRAAALAKRLHAAAADGDRGHDHTLDFDLCSVLAGVLATRGADFFSAFASSFGVTAPMDAEIRHYCGSPVRQATLPVHRGASRVLYVCDRCGAIADLPEDRLLAITVPSSRAGVAGIEVLLGDRLRGWQAGSVLPFGSEDERKAVVAPLEPRPFVPCEVDTTRGNRRYGLVVVSAGDYEVYQGVIWRDPQTPTGVP